MANILASQNMQFFPTDEFETHRLLSILGKVSVNHYQREIIKRDILGTELTQQLHRLSMDHNIPFDSVLYDYWLNNKEYDLIKKNFTYELGYKNDNPVTILDPCAGECKWLESIRSIIPTKSDSANEFVLIGNELDENRYNQWKN